MYKQMNEKVNFLVYKYGTRNPFLLADNLNIHVFFEDLGNTYGYFNTYKREKFIHVNENIPYHEQTFTCAHELKHALFDYDINTPFLSENTLLSVNRIELTANYFATKLLIEDKSFFQTSEKLLLYYGVPFEMERFVKYL